jgi:TrmH family RNA methyltransferase
MADLIITSPSNPRLKSLAGLRRRRTREETGQTLIEGYEELTLALGAGVRPEALYY